MRGFFKLVWYKNDVATKADIDASMQAAAQEAVTKTWNGTRPPNLRVPIYDGDGVRPSGEAFGEECRGHWVITASTKMKPQVVGIDNINTDLAPSDIYSGMYGRVTIRFFGYSNSGNKGVGCGLGNIMKTREGEPLAGNASAASDFAAVGNAVVHPQVPANAAAPWNTLQQPPAYPQTLAHYPNTAAAQHPAFQQQAEQFLAATMPGYSQQQVNINPLTGQPM